MQYCERCKVKVAGARKSCPLCQGPLLGEPCPEEEVFPRLDRNHRRISMFIRLLLLATVALAVICLAVDFMLPGEMRWSGFVVGGLASAWLLAAIALRVRRSMPKTILRLVILGAVLALLWDKFTGSRGWSVGYVVPILCTAAMVALMALPRILHLQLTDYMLYLVIDILFGILPAVFYRLGWLHTSLIPSLVCVVTSVISLTAVLLFQGRGFREELSRRMHL